MLKKPSPTAPARKAMSVSRSCQEARVLDQPTECRTQETPDSTIDICPFPPKMMWIQCKAKSARRQRNSHLPRCKRHPISLKFACPARVDSAYNEVERKGQASPKSRLR